jgi:replicative DNA helicase
MNLDDIPMEFAGIRVPPHSAEAEQSLLGGLLLDNAAFDRVADIVTEADFYSQQHKRVFASVAGIVRSGKPADTITVFERLDAEGASEEVGGLGYINALAQCVTSASNAVRYAEIVRERADLRRVIVACDEASTKAFGAKDIGHVVESLSATLTQIERRQMRKEPKRLDALARAALDRYTAMSEGKSSPAWATGIAPLDRLLNGGLRPGKVYGLAARPSVGKSSAARAIGLNLAAAGVPTLLLSQEMPDDEVADCALAQLGGIESHRLQTGRLADADWAGLSDAIAYVNGLPFYVDDDGGLTIQQIAAKARAIKGLKVLVLDYLQLSSSTLKNASTNDQVAEISKGLKALAMRMGLAVVVLSQLNREVEKTADKEPQLAHLRDSGAIEQDLDVAIMLWTVREPSDGPRFVGWKVPKHRGGRKGRFGMDFDAARYAWSESDEQLPSKSEPSRRGGFE